MAILDRPIPAKGLRLREPTIMLNILGGANPTSCLRLAHAAEAVGANVHLYGKGKATKGRKMGHLTVVGETMEEAEQDIKELIKISDEIRDEKASPPQQETPFPYQNPKRKPLVGIITGSISDQPHLEACYKILTDFDIPFEKGIKSAHRTPDAMAEYAKTAYSRGIKVVIASAGGAASLAPMVAAFAPRVSVIGLPIKPTIGDGMDSVLSMLNVPRGTPVATMALNNSTNAALLAARILAGWDENLAEKVQAYADRNANESLENDRRLREEDDGEK